MVQCVEGTGDVAGHGEVYGVIDVVPLEGEAAVESAFPVGGDDVEEFEGVNEVLGVVVANVFDSEVVGDERERHGASARNKYLYACRLPNSS
jgi:hypothetical protein